MSAENDLAVMFDVMQEAKLQAEKELGQAQTDHEESAYRVGELRRQVEELTEERETFLEILGLTAHEWECLRSRVLYDRPRFLEERAAEIRRGRVRG